MLTQKNLTSMMSQLLKVYDVSHEDGFLSILPLHHTFEFSTGFLLPFSRGSQITYLEELTSDSISDAFKNSHVTMVVGVPALWDLLRRRILNRFGDKSKKLESLVKALISINRWVREKTSLNVGPFLFYPVHHGLGGKIRFLISGGSALSEKTYETFYGLGFSLNEGYGLTESSPVLSVTRPGAKPKIGSVGTALPSVEIKILNPNEKGIGEVIARGPNIMSGYYRNKTATNSTIIDGWLHTGDLGYIDEDGNLFLVGRSKDLILGPSGKNIYPDEIEDLYRDSPYIKELSVVGLPDHNGERIACLVVPDYEYDKSLSHERVRSNIEEHFKRIASGLPVWKRITSLDFQDEELPRTGTRKVKRREVIKILQERHAKAAAPIELPASSEFQALTELISSVCGRPVEEIHRDTTFDELGFDSLMYSELGAAIEHSGRVLPSFEALGSITSVRQLADFLHVSSRTHAIAKRTVKTEDEEKEITLPGIIGDAGGAALDLANEIFYNSYLHADISGSQNIPAHTNFIVAPNHSSHLDTGLVKKALGDAGKNLAALAAKDYFFNNKLKRTFFGNFTNLIPMEREGSIHESLKLAVQTLQKGFNLLIFPEGTRSTSGQMTEFKSSLGYLALRAKRGILPIYLSGTHEAMPKGSKIPKKKKVKAAIGPYLEYEALEKFVEGLPRNDAYRLITLLVEQIVRKLKHGPVAMPDLTAVRNQWNRENQPKLQESASALGD
jgi:long-chain acyl-CoA synthetase